MTICILLKKIIYLEIKDISQLKSFSIIGFWGNDPCHLDYQGVLNSNGKGSFYLKLYDENNPKLLNPRSRPIDKTELVYGHGVMNELINGKESHLEIFVTLNVLSNVSSSIHFDMSGSTHFYLYDISSLNIGNWFYTNDVNLNKIDISLTNFTNFISSAVIHPIFKQDNRNLNYLLTLRNYLKSKKAGFCLPDKITCSLMQSFKSKNNEENINNNFTGVITNYDVVLSNLNIDKTKALFYKNAVLSWFSLITVNNEFCNKLTAFNDKNHYTFNLMNRQNINNNVELHKYSYMNIIDDHSDWLSNIFYSLKIWIINYKRLYPIFINVNLNNVGTIDQQLQNICVAFEMIYDNFLYNKDDENNRYHRIILFTKIDKVLENMNHPLIRIAIRSLKINNISDLINLIKQFRNELSHNTHEADETNLNFKILLLQILKALVIDWLKTRIMINRKYINKHYNFVNPFNTYSLYHNH